MFDINNQYSLQMKNLSFIPFVGKVSVFFKDYKKHLIYTGLFLFFLHPLVSHAQKLDEFKYASDKEGVRSIPYKDLFDEAGELQGEKNDAHKALEGYNASSLKTSKANLIRIKSEMQEDREKAEKALAADDKKSATVTKDLKSKLDYIVAEQKKLETEITDLNKKIEEGLKRRAEINRIRAEITAVYKKVDDELDRSLANPAPHIGAKPSSSDAAATKKYNEDLEDLKEYISKIKDKLERGFASHQTEIKDSKAAEETLRDALELK